MRYLALIPLALLMACDADGNLTLGGLTLTPEQRCVLHTGAAARYERILEEGGELSSVQRGLYDVALAGVAATCVTDAGQ